MPGKREQIPRPLRDLVMTSQEGVMAPGNDCLTANVLANCQLLITNN